jgi:hypothetical protein
MRNTLLASLAFIAVVGLALGGVAFAGDDVAPAKTATKTETPVAKAKSETSTPSPIHTMMKWVAKQVVAGQDCDCGCPSTPAGEKAWRVWFDAKDGPLADLRASFVSDGWNADRTVGFFKAMAAKKAAGCSDCEGCDKAKGAAAPAGDAGKTGDATKSKCCGGCDKSKAKGAAAPTGDAGKTGDATKSKCCGGCDKSKNSDCSGCDKAKAKGAAAPTGDAGTTGDSKCPCTGKNKADCGGCDKSTCPCGKDSTPSKAPSKTDG